MAVTNNSRNLTPLLSSDSWWTYRGKINTLSTTLSIQPERIDTRVSLFRQGQTVRIGLWSESGTHGQELALSTSCCVTVARNWASSSGKLAVYSSFTMHMYSGMPLRNANQPKEILNIISKFLSCASPVAARKLKSRDIKVTVTNKDYITKNKKSL